jgi:aspartate beta-hydroxylase
VTRADIQTLAAEAGLAARQNRWADAERLWQNVRAVDPKHPQALYSLAMHAWQRGDLTEALELSALAKAAAPNDPMISLSKAIFHRDSGDPGGELAAIEDTLKIDAYYLPALIAKAVFYEGQGQKTTAAILYRNALRVAPPEAHWPQGLRPQLLHARQMERAYSAAFYEHLIGELGSEIHALGGQDSGRWTEASSIMAGQSKPYLADCNQLYVPRLPAIPFYDRSTFSWVRDLEAQTASIGIELQTALNNSAAQFTPYIEYGPGAPVNQWADLNHSQNWSTFKLWNSGTPVHENLAQCPKTKSALEAVEMADIDGLCPNAMFSCLAPHTEIPPHHGETNARLIVHLPLIVPENCLYRVGFETRTWEVGKTLIFDDTLEHTARNDSDHLRVVLIFDVWNPLLSPHERDLVRGLAKAARSFKFD